MTVEKDPKAIVLFSGGQDSTTCLMEARNKFGPGKVFPLSINYGQCHEVELEQARTIVGLMGMSTQWRTLDVNALAQLEGSSLVGANVNAYAEKHGLPNTFVPGRNMLFLTLAAAYGARVGARTIYTGICASDEAGYPDCRPEFKSAAAIALCQALGDDVWIEAPLLHASKAETFLMAERGGYLDLIVNYTHTCYRGERRPVYPWGRGCGECDACVTRANGWDTAFLGALDQ